VRGIMAAVFLDGKGARLEDILEHGDTLKF
jgi:hypothetical protein